MLKYDHIIIDVKRYTCTVQPKTRCKSRLSRRQRWSCFRQLDDDGKLFFAHEVSERWAATNYLRCHPATAVWSHRQTVALVRCRHESTARSRHLSTLRFTYTLVKT